MKKILVLGFGNTICGDDGIGIVIINSLKKKINSGNIEIKEMQGSIMNLLDLIPGYDKLFIIDSISTRNGIPGNIYRFTGEDLETASGLCSSHQIGLASVIKTAEQLVDIPREIVIYAVEIAKKDLFSCGLSLKAEESAAGAVLLIEKELISQEVKYKGE